MNKIKKYGTDAAASHEFGIPSTTLRHAWTRGDIETATTACGLTLLYGPSVREYRRRYRPRNKISRVIRRRRSAKKSRGHSRSPRFIDARGNSIMWNKSVLGPAIKGNRKEMRINCERCKERVASKNVS